jgi:hypothetical protein
MDNGAPPPPDQQGAPPPDQQGAPPPDQGSDDSGASFDQFYNGLSSQGQWVQTPDYGYAFQPNVQDPNWAPYTDGHWVYTAYGWTWASDEPWGWATYHYGRWVNIIGTGWCWVPGYQWAPAWVSWRWGGGYAGWAPLPPSTFVGVEFGGPGVNLDFGFHFGSDCDTAYGIGPGCYNFIQIGFIGDPGYRGRYLDRGRNYVIINNTTNITNINISRGGTGAFGAVRTGGPSLAQVNAVSHTPIQQVRIAQSAHAGPGSLSGGTLNVFAPHFNPATARQARPATVARTLSNVQVNRGTSISHPMQVNAQFKPVAPSESAIAAAKAAAAHAPKNVATSARVAPTASAATIQKERTQSVQHQQTEATHPTASTPNHTTGGTPNEANEQAERERQQQAQGQEHAASTQQHEQAQQQQAQEQQHEAAANQQQHEEPARQEQTQTEQREPSEQHTSSQEEHGSSSSTPQHTSPQPQEHTQEHAPAPQPQHAQSGGGNSGGGSQNKKPDNNGQNQGQGH